MKKAAQKAQMSIATCQLYSSEPMVCPLCRVLVPAWTQHAYQQKEPK